MTCMDAIQAVERENAEMPMKDDDMNDTTPVEEMHKDQGDDVKDGGEAMKECQEQQSLGENKEGEIDVKDEGDETIKDIKPEGNPKKKRKVALYLAYVGHGYQGMQRNPGCKSIEDELFQAIYKAGGISDANADDEGFRKVHWSRAARTDKGVSAMCQVVSLMMILHPPGIVERINEHLPKQIRILGVHRVVKGFDCRKSCDKRRYEYIFPAWMFDPAVTSVVAESDGNENVHRRKRVLTERDANFVFDDACKEKMTSILRQFEGTHNFHNYTIRVEATAAQAKRYIHSFECRGTFSINGQEWVRMEVIGQSFMLHQIRKMIGMALAEYKEIAPQGSLKHALATKTRIVVPMAPDLGLFLDKCYYEAYNKQWGSVHEMLDGDVYAKEIEEFKMTTLYPKLAERDAEENVNAEWLAGLHEGSYKFSQWKSGKATGAAPNRSSKNDGKRTPETVLEQPPHKKPGALGMHLSAEYSD